MIDRNCELAVVGGGAKAAALAAKVHVLNRLGLSDVRLTVFERDELAATWSGRYGYTTGAELLGTRPEKDVGFPYDRVPYGRDAEEVNRLAREFSWHAYLVDMGIYGRWVDSGVAAPTHAEFGAYLSWVYNKATAGVQIRRTEVTGVRWSPGCWELSCQGRAGGRGTVAVSRGLVLTGSGPVRQLPADPAVEHLVLDVSRARTRLAALQLGRTARICVVGGGESAAAVALQLVQALGDGVELTFVAPTMPFSRGESFLENGVYSDPRSAGWELLPEERRLEFINRTDRAVMSVAALTQLGRHERVSFAVGRVTGVQAGEHGLAVVVTDAGTAVPGEFDAVVSCLGSSVLDLLTSLVGDQREELEQRVGAPFSDGTAIQRRVDESLALPGLRPYLHVPAAGTLRFGPGLANLSCLGTLSDRVLAPYLGTPVAAEAANTVVETGV